MSQLEVARNVLDGVRFGILQRDLLETVSKETGCSTESVRGSIIGYSPNKLYSQPWFVEKFAYCQKPSRIVRRDSLYFDPETEYKITYKSTTKQQIREKIFSHVSHLSAPKILTLAGMEGLDVKYFLREKPDATIYNAENNEHRFNEFQKTDVASKIFSFNCGIGEVIDMMIESWETLDLINYDATSYLCGYMQQDLAKINQYKVAGTVALTISTIKKIRNHGDFAEWAREMFGKHEDPTREILKSTMSNYELASQDTYRKDVGCIKMRTMIFTLKK